MTLLVALLAGVLTVAAPCTLPVLPVLLGGSIGRTSRLRPVFIASGFVVSFAAAVLVFSAVTHVAGIEPDTLRTAAVVLLMAFGVTLLVPRLSEAFAARVGGLTGTSSGRFGTDDLGGFLLGTTLGLVWTPCAGPVLGSILTVIATSADLGSGALLLLAYAIGAAVPMLAIAYGGQVVTMKVRGLARVSGRLRQGFGALIVAFALAMHLHYDVLVTASLARFYPGGRLGL